jgi:hypothetical protein
MDAALPDDEAPVGIAVARETLTELAWAAPIVDTMLTHLALDDKTDAQAIEA